MRTFPRGPVAGYAAGTGGADMDLAEMAIKVFTADIDYRAALQTLATIAQLSLRDFLR